ncbi:MAG: hypothetical protein AAF637_16815 [Pseudomonadota bacterium]
MRTALSGLLFALGLTLGVGVSHAQQSEFLGTWSAEIEILLVADGEVAEVPRVMSIVVEEVDGSHVRGYRQWEALTDVPGNVGGESTLIAAEPFIGAIDSDGVTLHLVEIEDSGMMFAELLGPDELEFTYMEAAPHAVVYTAILQRQAD